MNDLTAARSILRDGIDSYMLDHPIDGMIGSFFDEDEAISAALDHFDDVGPQILEHDKKALLVMARAELHRAMLA